MARTAIRHAIYSAAAAQSRFPVSPPHQQEPMRFQVSCVFRITVKNSCVGFARDAHRPTGGA
eukprot:scaffold33576_cov90-Isochrysis_galbana.AAC.1